MEDYFRQAAKPTVLNLKCIFGVIWLAEKKERMIQNVDHCHMRNVL
jgi:hypothetical protein